MGKQLYRSKMDGQLGYLVEHEGRQMIRLDRPNEVLHRPYSPATWVPELPEKPLAVAMKAMIAFEADKAMCIALGDYQSARRNWQSLKDRARIDWINNGPNEKETHGERRKRLFLAIMEAA